MNILIITLFFISACSKTETERITDQVKAQLIWDSRVDSGKINVNVKGNEVILSGSVPDYEAMQSAENDALRVKGVYDVTNHLIIEYPSSINLPTDGEIKKRVSEIS